MKSLIKIGMLLSAFFLVSCETEMIERFDEFSLEKGGYMRTVTPFPIPIFSVSKANMSGTKMEMVLEAVTADLGANFDSYEMVIRFLDNTPANGSNAKTDVALKTLTSSNFTKDPTTGYPRTTLTVTGKEMQDALKLTIDQIAAGDRFEIRAKMKLKDGKVFDASNSSGDILGGAFYSSPFLYRVNVAN
jgi:hypothetical protein